MSHIPGAAQAAGKLPEWHTPLPWAATTRQGSWDWVIYSTKDPNIEICQLFHDGTDDNETGEANAELIVRAVNALAAQPPAAPVGQKSAPVVRAPQNNAERLPSSDAAEAGADTCDCLPWPGKCPYCGGDAPLSRSSADTVDAAKPEELLAIANHIATGLDKERDADTLFAPPLSIREWREIVAALRHSAGATNALSSAPPQGAGK